MRALVQDYSDHTACPTTLAPVIYWLLSTGKLNFPSNLKYTSSHEWVDVQDDNVARVGITDFAQAST